MVSVSDVHEQQERWSPTPQEVRWDWIDSLTALSSTTNPLTATALIYALGAGITAGAGTRLVLQLVLDIRLIWVSPIGISQTPIGVKEAYFFSLPHQFFWHWAIYAPAALRRSGSRFSGSLSGIEP